MPRSLVAAAAALVLVAAGCGGSSSSSPPVSKPPSSSGLKGDVLVAKTRAPQIALHDADGRAVRLTDFRGRWVVVTFLYTHCPDVCPLIAQQLNAALARAPRLRVLAVTVDPARDTPVAVRRYVRSHGLRPAFRYLIGSTSRLRPVWRAWHVAVLRGPKATITHASFEVLVDPAGRERVYYGSNVKAGDVLHDLAKLS